MKNVLPKTFFNRDTLTVAEQLLGMFLVRKIGNKEIAHMITEVEAYDGPEDAASHASRGETPRNKIMFGEGGFWYVYLCYGVHDMLNIVTGPKTFPAAVLIRGIEGASGPGRVTKLLSIDRTLNRKKAGRGSGLWIEDRGVRIPKNQIQRTPRIGVAYAGPIWSKKKYRFILRGSTGKNTIHTKIKTDKI